MTYTLRVDEVTKDLMEVLKSLMVLRRDLALEVLTALDTLVDDLQAELDDAADEVTRGD